MAPRACICRKYIGYQVPATNQMRASRGLDMYLERTARVSLLVTRAQPTTNAVANYVTARFGSKPSQVTVQPRKQASQ